MGEGIIWAFMKRNDWGAEPPREAPTPHVPHRISIHHSFIPNIVGFHGADSVAGIQRYHQRNKGWSDIAYHFLVSPDGKYVYEGRDPETVGAHCGGTPPKGVRRIFGNTGTVGICLIGDYDHEVPLLDGISTLMSLVEGLRMKYGIPESQVFGHFEAWSRPPKTCPGKPLVAALGWKARWNRAFPNDRIK